jgi:hypothetical protein
LNAKVLILIGTAVAIVLCAVGIVWVPYSDTGTPEAANHHFLALGITLLDVFALFVYGAFRSSQRKHQNSYSGITTSYFLSINAFLTLSLFARTYFGMHYLIFWSLQGLQWAAVSTLWFAGNHLGQVSGERDSQATIARIRKQSLIDELETMRRRYPAGDDVSRRTLLSLASKLEEELRYFPNQNVTVTAGNPFSRVMHWRAAVENYLIASPNVVPPSAPHDLVVEAGSIVNALAGHRS